jgi:hypothetical protein
MAKTDETQDQTETIEAQPTEATTSSQPEKKSYFFPPDFSCEATSLEEAQKIYEQHQKGTAQPA